MAEMLRQAKEDLETVEDGRLPVGIRSHQKAVVQQVAHNAREFLWSPFADCAFYYFGMDQRRALRGVPRG